MDLSICLNSISTPADNAKEAYNLFLEACYGVLELGVGRDDRYFLFYDDIKNRQLNACPLAYGYNYEDFLNELKEKNEQDLLLFLIEMDDKSPAIDYLSLEDETLLDELASYSFYLPETGTNQCMDTLGIAWLLDAYLLSLPTRSVWDSSHVEIARIGGEQYREERLLLKNIARREHGTELREERDRLEEVRLEDICPTCLFSTDFFAWYNGLSNENKHRIKNKLRVASERNFQGGKPLFDTLKEADGMREIRMFAYPGGAMRILFGAMPESRQAILIGFIKKDDKEGYDENIPSAKELWDNMISRQ